MSRLNPEVHEEDRQAFIQSIKANKKKQQIKDWLRANPEVGVLNGGKYYVIRSKQAIYIEELKDLNELKHY